MRSKTMDLGSKRRMQSPPGDFSRTATQDKPRGIATGGGAGSGDGIYMNFKLLISNSHSFKNCNFYSLSLLEF